MSMAKKTVRNLVVDSGAFIRNAPIGDVGEKIYTLRDVVNEIRDKETRQRLELLTYDLTYKEPTTEAIHAVTEFAKKTGDFRSLSAVDLRVLSLVYQLEKENVGVGHIKTVPEHNVSWSVSTQHLEKPTSIAGFYLDKQINTSRTPTTSEETQADSTSDGVATDKITHDTNESMDISDSMPDIQQGDTITTEQLAEDEEDDETNDDDAGEDDDEDDDDGWITPFNIKEVRKAMGDQNMEEANVIVGCMTTDFAMQNILIQMGLNVVSVDGMLIKRAKNYVLRCSGCSKVTTNLQKVFCFHCGNQTLQKVSMTVEKDGSIKYFLSRRKQMNTRGLRYSLPQPQGGKYASNPVLVEDQEGPHQRMSNKAKVKYHVLDADYIANTSPFAPIDTTSRSAQLGVRNHKHNFRSKRNPNENKKVYGRRK